MHTIPGFLSSPLLEENVRLFWSRGISCCGFLVGRREKGRRVSPGRLSGLDFFFVLNTVRADYSVTECLLAISIIMLERHRHPFLHTASQRDDTSPPARLPAPRLHPLYFAGSSGFYPQVALCFFFFVIPTISAAHSRSMCFFPRLPCLADSPTRLLHRRTAG